VLRLCNEALILLLDGVSNGGLSSSLNRSDRSVPATSWYGNLSNRPWESVTDLPTKVDPARKVSRFSRPQVAASLVEPASGSRWEIP
jgi:hypothetical protein